MGTHNMKCKLTHIGKSRSVQLWYWTVADLSATW